MTIYRQSCQSTTSGDHLLLLTNSTSLTRDSDSWTISPWHPCSLLRHTCLKVLHEVWWQGLSIGNWGQAASSTWTTVFLTLAATLRDMSYVWPWQSTSFWGIVLSKRGCQPIPTIVDNTKSNERSYHSVVFDANELTKFGDSPHEHVFISSMPFELFKLVSAPNCNSNDYPCWRFRR